MRTIDFYWFLSYMWETGRGVSTGLIPTDAGMARRGNDREAPDGARPT